VRRAVIGRFGIPVVSSGKRGTQPRAVHMSFGLGISPILSLPLLFVFCVSV
jgi:hypothetical protein